MPDRQSGRVAPNLIKDLEPSAPDQVWVSDITYISTLEGWLYLAVILDLFSRKVVGWKLGETLEARLVVRALRNALILRQPNPGLYFHSDRGSQYSSCAEGESRQGRVPAEKIGVSALCSLT